MTEKVTTDDSSIDSAASALSAGLGRCCYGGVKPKTECASCASWKLLRFVEAKSHGKTPPNYACDGCSFVSRPTLCAMAIEGAAKAAFGGDCDERDVIYVEAPNVK